MSTEVSSPSGGYDATVDEGQRALCARLNVLCMLKGDSAATDLIQDRLAVNEIEQSAAYKCPVPVCDSIVSFMLHDGQYDRDGLCPFVMNALRRKR